MQLPVDKDEDAVYLWLYNALKTEASLHVPNGAKIAQDVDAVVTAATLNPSGKLIALFEQLELLGFHIFITLDECQKLFEFRDSARSLNVGSWLKSLCYSHNLRHFAFIFVSTSLSAVFVNLEMLSANHVDFIDSAAKIYLTFSHVSADGWNGYFKKLIDLTQIPPEQAKYLFKIRNGYSVSPAYYAHVAKEWTTSSQETGETIESFALRVLETADDKVYRTVARGKNFIIFILLLWR